MTADQRRCPRCWSSGPLTTIPLRPRTTKSQSHPQSLNYSTSAVVSPHHASGLTSHQPHDPHEAQTTLRPLSEDASSILYNIRPPNSNHSKLLSCLPTDHIYSVESLLHALQTPLDQPSLIHLTRLIASSVPHLPLNSACQILRKMNQSLGRLCVLAVTPSLVTIFLRRLDQAVSEETLDLDIRSVLVLYRLFIRSFRHYPLQGTSNQHRFLPDTINIQLVRIFRHLFNLLRSLPSTSDGFKVYNNLAFLLFSNSLFSPKLREVLVEEMDGIGVKPGPAFWNKCLMSAVAERNIDMATVYMARKDKAEGTEGTVDDSTTKIKSKEPRSFSRSLMLSRLRPSFPLVASVLRPYLLESTTKQDTAKSIYNRSVAWSVLITQAGRQRDASARHIVELYRHIPASAVCAPTTTAAMQSLYDLRKFDKAWTIWVDSVKLHSEAKEGDEERYVDCVELSVATLVQGRREGIAQAVKLVDSWGRRKGYDTRQMDLDVININSLLTLCANHHAPSIAFRLWAAAHPRWNVYPDGVSLTLLLNAARFYETKPGGKDDIYSGARAQFRLLWKDLASAGEDVSRNDAYDAYDADGFSRGGTSVLLDPPGYSWHDQYDERPWQKARQVFREVVLTNWPHLEQVKSPLDVSMWMAFFASPSPPSTSQEIRLPRPGARYTHVIPSQETWHAYINLLGSSNQVGEISLALAWMRELDVRPSWRCMCSALTYLGEVERPRRRVKRWDKDGGARFVRDLDILRKWLEEWVGVGKEVAEDGSERCIVPTDGDVFQYRWELIAAGKKLIL